MEFLYNFYVGNPILNCSKNWISARFRGAQGGFTLIELMIVVGIIGILVSVAAPMYSRYQRKARQAEAKLALGSIYSLQRSFHSEYSSYIPSLDAIGYAPEGERRFYVHAACLTDAWAGSVNGYSGSTAVTQYGLLNNPYTWTNTYANLANCNTPYWDCSDYGSNPQDFNMIAVGQLGPSLNVDTWVINDRKALRNCSTGF
jgi:prepilin-type N-terminal cleavage/methylation domain-containing protein